MDRAAVVPPKRRSLIAACTAHVLHDGYMDLLYVLLPIWQSEFGLGYAALGLLAHFVGRQTSVLAVAATALATVPLTFVLARTLRQAS